MKKLRLFLALSVFVIMVNACALSNSSGQNPLEGTSWVLTSIDQNSPIEPSEVTITFEDGMVAGQAGCNSYSSSFLLAGESISFGPIVQTEMFCGDIPGIMHQEGAYLAILGAALKYDLTGEILTILSENDQTLTFRPLAQSPSVLETPSNDRPSVSQTNPNTGSEQTQSTEAIEPPIGYKEYKDSQTGISIYIPEDWFIQNQNIVEGEYAIFSSYPPDKYVGGEARQAGDVKCDLNLNPDVSSNDDLIQQWDSSSITTIVSEEEILLSSGNSGTILVIDSMGRSTTLVTKINNKLITFTCWGESVYFKQIAVTLRGSDANSP